MRIHYKDPRENQITLDLWQGKSGFAYCLFVFRVLTNEQPLSSLLWFYGFPLSVNWERLVLET